MRCDCVPVLEQTNHIVFHAAFMSIFGELLKIPWLNNHVNFYQKCQGEELTSKKE